MTPRENLIALLKRERYEWAPVTMHLCPSLLDSFKTKYQEDGDYASYFQIPWREVEHGKINKVEDDVYINYYPFELKEGVVIDQWGVAHEPGSEAAMHMTYMRHPLESITTVDGLMDYPYPSYDKGDYSHQQEQVKHIHDQGLAAIGDMQMTIWERSWYLRGMEQLMMDMLLDKEKATIVIDRVLELSIKMAVEFTKAGCDILYFGDDIGMQSTLLMSIDMYVEWFKPRLKKLIDTVKAINPNIIVFYHSCGFVEPFIPHLIEAGIDVLNPIQPECMDFKKLHALYSDQISFHGTIGTQTTMPFGSPEEVKSIVSENLKLTGSKGGLLCSPTHLLEPEVPWENIIAYVDACKEFKPNQ